jgi:hypothetical protein
LKYTYFIKFGQAKLPERVRENGYLLHQQAIAPGCSTDFMIANAEGERRYSYIQK